MTVKYKDILVHLDQSAESDKRLTIAVGLSLEHEAHLTGLYVKPKPYIPPIHDLGQLPPEYLKQQEQSANTGAAEVEVKFLKAVKAAGIEYEWRCDSGLAGDRIPTHARYCDLLILGQKNPEDGNAFGDFPDSIILTVGCPVLIVPYATNIESVGSRVMVGWDASAQAARAVNDALPLISRADQVKILAVNPSGTGDHGDMPCADISLHLARHGVTAEAQSLSVTDIGVADMLLSRAADEGVDLFVMGAYGHSRWREMVLGGVTAHMLKHMTMPVLMAH
jgi:nucleotide-binding universal stress UspA family protein